MFFPFQKDSDVKRHWPETSMFLDDGDETKSFCHGMHGGPPQFWENVGDSHARDKSQDSHGPSGSFGSSGPTPQ